MCRNTYQDSALDPQTTQGKAFLPLLPLAYSPATANWCDDQWDHQLILTSTGCKYWQWDKPWTHAGGIHLLCWTPSLPCQLVCDWCILWCYRETQVDLVYPRRPRKPPSNTPKGNENPLKVWAVFLFIPCSVHVIVHVTWMLLLTRYFVCPSQLIFWVYHWESPPLTAPDCFAC